MKVVIGSVIVILIAAVVTWFLASLLFKPIGGVVKKSTSEFKKKWRG